MKTVQDILFSLPAPIVGALHQLDTSGLAGGVWLAGGALRDMHEGITPKDYDLWIDDSLVFDKTLAFLTSPFCGFRVLEDCDSASVPFGDYDLDRVVSLVATIDDQRIQVDLIRCPSLSDLFDTFDYPMNCRALYMGVLYKFQYKQHPEADDKQQRFLKTEMTSRDIHRLDKLSSKFPDKEFLLPSGMNPEDPILF